MGRKCRSTAWLRSRGWERYHDQESEEVGERSTVSEVVNRVFEDGSRVNKFREVLIMRNRRNRYGGNYWDSFGWFIPPICYLRTMLIDEPNLSNCPLPDSTDVLSSNCVPFVPPLLLVYRTDVLSSNYEPLVWRTVSHFCTCTAFQLFTLFPLFLAYRKVRPSKCLSFSFIAIRLDFLWFQWIQLAWDIGWHIAQLHNFRHESGKRPTVWDTTRLHWNSPKHAWYRAYFIGSSSRMLSLTKIWCQTTLHQN